MDNDNQFNQQVNNEFNQQENNQVEQQNEIQQEPQNKNKKTLLSILGIAILVIGLVGVTYAFFNYTRTGSSNIIKTGRITFNSTQGTSMNLNNLFPIDPEETGIMNDATKVGTLTIKVTGDTTYEEGVEYKVSAVNVQNTVGSGANAKSLPISIAVSVTSNTYGEEPNQTTTTLGTSDDSYFTNRGPNAETSIYKVLAKDVISNNDELLVGYIKTGATGIDGNIVIKAYIDESKIAISDTYPGQTVDTVKTTGYSSSACETALTGEQDASTYCATASALQDAIDGGDLTSAQITALVTAGIVEEYTDGTTSEWVGDRTRFTTDEWNSLQANGVSFQIKVEANQGIWVEEPGELLYDIITEDAELDNVNSDYVQNVNASGETDAKVMFLNNVESQGKVLRLSAGVDFSQPSSSTNGEGLYIRYGTQNDTYPIYYYRGNVENNNVAFAGYCWQIVRTTNAGGIKMIYNGEQDEDGTCMPLPQEATDEATIEVAETKRIGPQTYLTIDSETGFAFNDDLSVHYTLAFAGYMYGEAVGNEQKSVSGQPVYKFGSGYTYENGQYTLTGMADGYASSRPYTCYNTTGVCDGADSGKIYYALGWAYYVSSDKTAGYYYELSGGDDLATTFSRATENTYDSTAKQIVDEWYSNNLLSYTNKLEDAVYCNRRSFISGGLYSFSGMTNSVNTHTPDLTCSANDSFTVSSANGNGALTYPVGLLTVDEMMLAGASDDGYAENNDTYLWNGDATLSMSPASDGYIYALWHDGFLGTSDTARVIRPVITLKHNAVISSVGGDGTAADPYVVR